MIRSKQSRKRTGFSLIELLAVLVVLVAVAGLAVNTLPNVTEQGHRATGASAMTNLNNALNTFVQIEGSHPDNLDALQTDVSTADSLYNKPDATTPGINSATDAAGTPQNLLDSQQLTTGKLDSLNAIGITTVIEHGGGNATYESADVNGTAATLSATDYVATLGTEAFGSAAATNFTGLPDLATGDYYVVFGVGKSCDMVGVTLQEPPTHFDADNPGTNYSRFGLVYEVFEDGSPAEFKGAVAFHGDNVVPFWRALNGFRAEQYED